MRLSAFIILFFLLPIRLSGQSTDADKHKTEGKASYYARKFDGRRTASGELFDNADYTAAHRTLPFNTYLNVVNKTNNLNVIVRVNDRGPYTSSRVIDLSEAASRRIGGYHHGLVPVHIEVLRIIHLTPTIDSLYHASEVVDCMGEPAELSETSISLWSTHDLLHAIYTASDLYLKEPVDKILIVNQHKASGFVYHVVITGIKKEKAAELTEYYQNKGFGDAHIFKKSDK